MTALHRHKGQWQDPLRFEPDRFDNNHPLSLTPSGKKRTSHTYSPFSAGRRVCFGKTFAESNMKIFAIYMATMFDMRYVDSEKYPDTHSLPLNQVGMTHVVPLKIALSLKK